MVATPSLKVKTFYKKNNDNYEWKLKVCDLFGERRYFHSNTWCNSRQKVAGKVVKNLPDFLGEQHFRTVLDPHSPYQCETSLRAVFIWMSKATRICFGFALLRLVIGLKISRHFLIQSEIKPNQSWLAYTRFPAFYAGYTYLLRVLIGSLDCLRLLWLARVTLWFWFYDTQMKTALTGY